MAERTKVFISYSQDSPEHARRVLDLADALQNGGLDVILDQYVHPAPDEGWPLWMERNLKAADFVLLVCTETYCRRVRAEETPGQGTGVRWEGRIVYNELCYGDNPGGTRFIPILLPGAEPIHIPDPVCGYNHYRLATFNLTDPGFQDLYRHLTNQPATHKPDLGALVILPPISRPRPPPGPLPPSGGPVWNVPYPRNSNFTGREAILKQLETALASGRPAALSQAIAGLGGVGKTQTAVEYAYRHRAQYRAVLWVRADPGWVRPDPGTNLVSSYRELAEALGLPEKDESDSTKVVAAVRRWLGREPGYLLILDNADDPALVRPYLPPDPKGHVLLTSRAQNFDVVGICRPIWLPALTPDEALEFLRKRTGREGPLDPAEQASARTLAGELGYLPLALEQAAAYMVEHEEAFAV
ncbi:MAG: TIR domain-containing protein, partial [Singulisphaera sp.]|nr:TIR domain-containing protein [Singulisphaera sp.]